MKVEYETKVSDDIREGVARIIRYVKENRIIQGNERTQLIADLLKLSFALEQPITGTVEVDPEDVERDPYPIWEDMD